MLEMIERASGWVVARRRRQLVTCCPSCSHKDGVLRLRFASPQNIELSARSSPLRSELPYMGFGNSERSRLLDASVCLIWAPLGSRARLEWGNGSTRPTIDATSLVAFSLLTNQTPTTAIDGKRDTQPTFGFTTQQYYYSKTPGECSCTVLDSVCLIW